MEQKCLTTNLSITTAQLAGGIASIAVPIGSAIIGAVMGWIWNYDDGYGVGMNFVRIPWAPYFSLCWVWTLKNGEYNRV